MKKEVFLAVLVGFILGLVITFGIWTANNNLKPKESQVTPTPSHPSEALREGGQPTTAPTSANPLTLTLTSPDNELFTNKDSVTVSGTTAPDSTVVILSEQKEFTLLSDSKGAFSLDLSLEGGYNRLTVTVFDAAGNSASKQLLVTYSTTKI